MKLTLKNVIKLWWHCLIKHHHLDHAYTPDDSITIIFCMECDYGQERDLSRL